MLKFSPANSKIKALAKVPTLARYLTNKRKVYSLDLLSGWSCPYAKDCLSKVVEIDGRKKIKDGPDTQWRCFSASQEVLFSNVYNLRKHNLDLLGQSLGVSAKFNLLKQALPTNAGIIRIHVGGDFFNRDYFDAWFHTALENPNVLFYAYTKSLKFWVNKLDSIPDNFVITASRGGRLDELIGAYKLREAVVVFSEEEARNKGLEIDHTDEHAAQGGGDFALMIHGTQPAGSEASEAIKELKRNGVRFSYPNN